MARQILIVDQSNSMRRIIKNMIIAEVNDAEISESHDVGEARERLKTRDFHLVLFSRESSSQDWLDLIKKRRETAGMEKPAFVLFTSSKQKGVYEEFVPYGVKEHITIPCSPHELGEIVNRACSVFALRSGRRYSLPAATAILEQGASSVTAELVNFSEGGMLCELTRVEAYSWSAPTMVTLNLPFENEKVVATGLFSTTTRLSISESFADHTPKRVRIAFRFITVPSETKRALDRAFAHIEKQEGMVD